MSSQNSSEEQNEKSAHHSSNTELIMSITYLRNLYQIGFNSRSLTKGLVTGLKIDEISSSIIDYAKSNELSVKSYGPLLLGLVRIYDKKLKLLLEEATSLFRQRARKEDAQENRTAKVNGKKSVDNKIVSSKKKIDIDSSTNLLSLSPMQNSVFTLMNSLHSAKKSSKILTPSKQSMELLSIDSKELLRRSAQKNSMSQNIMLNTESAFSHQLSSNQIKKEKGNEDIENFFDFIKENNGQNEDMLFADENRNDDMIDDLNLNLGIDTEMTNQVGKISLNSISIDEGINSKLKRKEKTVRLLKGRNAKFQYDETVHIPIGPIGYSSSAEDMKSLRKYFNFLLKFGLNKEVLTTFNDDPKFQYLYPSFENQSKNEEEKEKADFISEKKNISIDDFNSNSKTLIHNLSRLTLNKEDFDNTIPFVDNVAKIEEEEANDIMDEEIPDLSNIKYDEETERKEKEDRSKEDEKKEINELEDDLKEKYLKKKKDVLFTSISDKYDTPVLFYNLLVLAQIGGIELTQEEMFRNDTIHIIKAH